MAAIHLRWPRALIQHEDFQTKHAVTLLKRYRSDYLMFNDDIQVSGLPNYCSSSLTRRQNNLVCLSPWAPEKCSVRAGSVVTQKYKIKFERQLSGRVSHSSSGDRRIPQFRKSSMVWIWQHDKRTDDYKIILNCVRNRKRGREMANFFVCLYLSSFFKYLQLKLTWP